MTTLRRFAYAVFGVACTHLVFGAIVRISGSGMGCGPHWPDCEGHLIPPMNRPDLIIEVTHRYLASILLLSLIGLSVAAWRRRAEPGVGGRGGVLRMALTATGLGFCAAILGAVTVKYGNAPFATVAHWTVAMSLVAAVTATVIRAGGLGGASARLGGASGRTRRGTLAGAAMALAAVVMGGLTAKVQGGPIACLAFPLCGANPDVPRAAVHVQSTHRVLAVLLVLHLIGLFFGLRRRQEPSVLRRAASVALGLGVLQLLIAGAMIGMHLPPALRSLHEATGVSIWIATFTLAYLARLASDDRSMGASSPLIPVLPLAPVDLDPLAAASVRAAPSARPVHASAAPAAPAVTGQAAAPLANEPRTTPTAALTAVPVLEPHAMPMAYLPPAPSGDERVAEQADDVEIVAVAPAPLRLVRADEPIELPPALAHASRIASASALAFHECAGAAVLAAAVHEREVALALHELADRPGAAVEHSAPDVDSADVVEVEVLALVQDVERVATDATEAPLVVAESTGADAVTAPVAAVLSLPEAAALTMAGVVTDVLPHDAEVTVAVGVEDPADVAAAECRGGPPEVEEVVMAVEEQHPSAARVTIFDAPAADTDAEDDGLYNLRDLADADDDAADVDQADDEVPTLDEEFSRRAMASEVEDHVVDAPIVLAPVAVLDEVTSAGVALAPAAAVAPRPSRATLTAISALRRPAMSHSIAVIVARGADV